MRFSVLAPFALSFASGASAKAPCAHKVKESIANPTFWKKVGVPPASHSITLGIALPQLRFDELHQHLVEISDPAHGRYAQHMSDDQVLELVAPHGPYNCPIIDALLTNRIEDSLSAVNAWLESHGLSNDDISRSPAGDWAHISIRSFNLVNLIDSYVSETAV